MSRLPIKDSVLKRLFAMSGNICAHPDCSQVLYRADGTGYVNVCHIHSAEKGWFRHDPNLDDEALRAIENLILLCTKHHGEIDQPASAETADVIRAWKAQHEAKYTDMAALFGSRLVDRVGQRQPIAPTNLLRLLDIFPDDYTSGNLAELLGDLTKFMAKIANVPPAPMEFMVKAITHGLRGGHRGGIGSMSISVPAHELQDVVDLSATEITQHCQTLEHYELGYLQDDYPVMVSIQAPAGYLDWEHMMEALKVLQVDLETLLQRQDFSIFDR